MSSSGEHQQFDCSVQLSDDPHLEYVGFISLHLGRCDEQHRYCSRSKGSGSRSPLRHPGLREVSSALGLDRAACILSLLRVNVTELGSRLPHIELEPSGAVKDVIRYRDMGDRHGIAVHDGHPRRGALPRSSSSTRPPWFDQRDELSNGVLSVVPPPSPPHSPGQALGTSGRLGSSSARHRRWVRRRAAAVEAVGRLDHGSRTRRRSTSHFNHLPM